MHKIIFILILTAMLTPSIVSATVMNSINYQVQSNVIGPGVLQTATSTNYTVEYSPGEKSTVVTYACNDNADNDSDGLTDYPNDPGCSSATDNDETNTVVSTPSTSVPSVLGGGGIVGLIVGRSPSHIDAFNVPLNILPTQSGTLTMNLSDNKIVKLEVQKGITKNQIVFVIREELILDVRIPKPEFSAKLIGKNVFSVTAQDAQGNQISVFSKPIIMNLTIPELLQGRDDLGAYYFDRDTREWILISDAVFTEDKATFSVDHLTVFAIFSVPEKPNTIPVATGAICDPVSDGVVDILDFNAMMVAWGLTGEGNTADCNSDGAIDILDFNSLMISWNR